MKKNLLCLSICLITCPWLAFSQAGEWTWMSGVNTTNFQGSFGTQGVPSPTNSPPGEYEDCEWKDHQGNFWLYGGTFNNYGDLWRYNPATNEWTWMTGTGLINAVANYGIQGVPSPTNAPGYRGYGMMTWTDTTGNLWMYGGYAAGYLSDLWKYDIVSNLWTWMSGGSTVNDTGSFGIQGVASPTNKPPPLCEDACTWLDRNNNLWLYGGYLQGLGFSAVWKYDITANEWTWMKGDSVTNSPPVYGTMGVPDPNNTPGGRWEYTHWTNDSIHFWTFGGETYNGARNDMWMYNSLTNNWTWMNGPNVASDPGSLGIQCVTSATNVPASRYEDRSSVTDKCGKFWLYGGGLSMLEYDLWKYDPVINQWTYIGPASANATPVYGTKGIPNAANTPGARMGANAWMDAQNNYWIFGGYSGTYGDLWRYTPDSTCGGSVCGAPPPVALFQSSDTTFCTETGKCIHFYDLSTGNPTSWKWLFPGAIPDSSLLQNPDSICYYTPGTYPVTLIISNANGTDTLAVTPLIIFGTAPVPPTVTVSGDTLFCTSAQHYQWYYNGAPITGAIDSFYVATQSGTYSAQITDNGCTVLSNGVAVTITSVIEHANSEIKIYPNPAKDRVEISGLKGNEAIEIYNVLGELVYSSLFETGNPKSAIRIDISSFSKGVYIISIIQVNSIYRAKIVKQ
jgi:PKD repeat protein